MWLSVCARQCNCWSSKLLCIAKGRNAREGGRQTAHALPTCSTLDTPRIVPHFRAVINVVSSGLFGWFGMTMDPTRKRDLAVLLSATPCDDQAVPAKAMKRSHSDSSVCLTGGSCSSAENVTYFTQSVHQPRLSLDQAGSTSVSSEDESCLVQPDRPTGYSKWWRNQQSNLQQKCLTSYSVRLIGDAAAPHLGCYMLKTDLALCR